MKVEVMSFEKLMDLQAAAFFLTEGPPQWGFVPKWYAQFKQKIHINLWQNNTAIKLKPIIGDWIFLFFLFFFNKMCLFTFLLRAR